MLSLSKIRVVWVTVMKNIQQTQKQVKNVNRADQFSLYQIKPLLLQVNMKWLKIKLLFAVPANIANFINIHTRVELQPFHLGLTFKDSGEAFWSIFGPRTPPPLYNQNSPKSPSLNSVISLRDVAAGDVNSPSGQWSHTQSRVCNTWAWDARSLPLFIFALPL